MNVLTSRTVRFAKVVETAGTPEVISLWTKPERDQRFMTAVRQNRVMTIKQQTVGSAKDFGLVGFLREKNVSYLIFPRSLKPFQDCRVVEIIYDLIKTSEPLGHVIKPDRRLNANRTRKNKPAARQTRAVKHAKRFKILIRFSAPAQVQQTLQADSKKQAKSLALQKAAMPDLRRGTVTRNVLKDVCDQQLA